MRASSPRSQAKHAPVAQLDRASDYESEGRTFESFRARHLLPPRFLVFAAAAAWLSPVPAGMAFACADDLVALANRRFPKLINGTTVR